MGSGVARVAGPSTVWEFEHDRLRKVSELQSIVIPSQGVFSKDGDLVMWRDATGDGKGKERDVSASVICCLCRDKKGVSEYCFASVHYSRL